LFFYEAGQNYALTTGAGKVSAYGWTEAQQPTSTPELSTWALLACSGLAGFVLRRRRKA
jgi:MprA protease rhombosortase-interaction domain-containing protein